MWLTVEHLSTTPHGKTSRIDACIPCHDGLDLQRLKVVRDTDDQLEDVSFHGIRHAHLPLNIRKQRCNAKPSKADKTDTVWPEAMVIFGGKR